MSLLKRGMIVLIATLALLASLVFVWRIFGPRNFFGAFLLNLLPTSWSPCVKSALVLHLPAGYYPLRHFEQGTSLYERLGIRWFQTLMRTPVFGILNLDIPRRFRKRDFVGLEREMRFAETSHVFAFLLVLGVLVFALAQGWWDAVVYLTVWNLLVNVYPVMLQRYNRGRLLCLMERSARRVNSGVRTVNDTQRS
jgi:hypothetical protein